MGIFNEISQTVAGGPVGQTETNFDVVLSKYASNAHLDRVSRGCFRKGQDVDMEGHKIFRPVSATITSLLSNKYPILSFLSQHKKT